MLLISLSVPSDEQVSNFREVLVNGEVTFDSSTKVESSFIMEEIINCDVPQKYSGPRISMPLTLEKVQEILDHFKKGEVSNDSILISTIE